MDKAKAKRIAETVYSGRSVLVLCESQHHIGVASKAVAELIPDGKVFVYSGNIRRGEVEVRFISLMGPDGRRPSEFDEVVVGFDVSLEQKAGAA